jgi:hypothetical protein
MFEYDNQYNKTWEFLLFLSLLLSSQATVEKFLQIIKGIIQFRYNIPHNSKPVSCFNQQNISGSE